MCVWSLYVDRKVAAYRLGDVVGQAQRRNPTSSTEVVGHINQSSSLGDSGGGSSRSNIVALCTLDGELSMKSFLYFVNP